MPDFSAARGDISRTEMVSALRVLNKLRDNTAETAPTDRLVYDQTIWLLSLRLELFYEGLEQ